MRLGGAAAAAATVLLLCGCGSQVPAPAPTPSVTVVPPSASAAPTPRDSTSPTPSTSASASATASTPPSSGTADPDRPAGQCADDDLGVQVIPADDGGAAGSTYSSVLLTNTGGSSCVLRGTPGVSVVRGTAQLGPAADRIETGVKTLRLGVGESVAASLKVVDVGDDGGPLDGCTVARGTGYRVYPPHSTRAFLVKDADARACADGPVFMTVSPVARFSG